MSTHDAVVDALIALADRTVDIQIASAAIKALGKLGSPRAVPFLETLRNHPNLVIREEVRGILDRTAKPSNRENNGADL